jgi:hypothetical protein
VAGGSALLALASARRAKRSEAAAQFDANRAETYQRRATEAAEEATVAQRQSAIAAKRVADALEKQHQLEVEQAEAAEGVPWRVEHSRGAKWLLRNNTDHPKFHVQISGPGVSTTRAPGVIPRIDGRSSFEFWGNTAFGSEARIDVTWHRREDRQDVPGSWSDTMPPGA